ncbi:MAG: diaminopimelate epimerase [Bacteroidales bacterium]|nr:diaminopimelate epimerase [Bacteroidales bacterium]
MSNIDTTLFLFTGAGNNFVVIDGREGDSGRYRQVPVIKGLCGKYSTDGLMILTEMPGQADFVMDFFNPDGSGGMMCGNGGRCIVAFANYLGLKPASEDGVWHFMAPDGPHEARILSHEAGKWTVRLKMIDVEGITPVKNGYFLNTGTRHYVEFRDNVDSIDMEKEAKPIRWDAAFQPEGTNVNFVERIPQGLKVRTFEKGVEGETLACGTGITASAIAFGAPTKLQCRRGDWLSVEFTQDGPGYRDVFLTGPAELVKTIDIC